MEQTFHMEPGRIGERTMKDILTAPFLTEMRKTAANMYRLGWDERNGGNISYLLEESEVAQYLDLARVIRTIPLGFDASPLAGRILIVTGTGKYFKNVEADPEQNLGILRISPDGMAAELLWGYRDGGSFTSELPAHLMSHMARLCVEPQNRVVMHSHPTHTLAMNYVHELDERKLTHTLWEMCTECIVVFPDGVGVLPWMLCGTNEIGRATAEKMKEFRLVIWGMHGIYAAGKTMDETFGLIETVEKAAQIFMLTAHLPRINTIQDAELARLAEAFGVDYRRDFRSAEAADECRPRKIKTKKRRPNKPADRFRGKTSRCGAFRSGLKLNSSLSSPLYQKDKWSPKPD